jgi:hypothetical protein
VRQPRSAHEQYVLSLGDPNIPLSFLISACPFNDLTTLCVECLRRQVVASRLLWAMHVFLFRNAATPSKKNRAIQNIFGGQFITFDNIGLLRLAIGLLSSDLLDRSQMLTIISEIGQIDYIRFLQKEIIGCWPALRILMKKESASECFEIMSRELLIRKSELIQFCLRKRRFWKSFGLDNSVKRRILAVANIMAFPKSVSATIYEILVEDYPYFNVRNITKKVSRIVEFFDAEDMQVLALKLVKMIEGFPLQNFADSSTIAVIISSFHITFPSVEFFAFLFKRYDVIEKYVHIFMELQIQGLFNYCEFLDFVKGSGNLVTNFEISKRMILTLPAADMNSRTSARINALLTRFRVPEKGKLPNLIRYALGFQVLETGASIDDLIKLETESLIPTLLSRCRDLSNIISIRHIPLLRKIIPVFVARGTYDSFSNHVFEKETPALLELGVHLIERYHARPKNRSEIVEKINTFFISPDLIRRFFLTHSCFCDFESFDSLQSVASDADFLPLLRRVILAVTQFPGISDRSLFNFFLDFADSNCISRAFIAFTNSVITVCLHNEFETESDPWSVLVGFFSLFFSAGFTQPSDVLILAWMVASKSGSMNLVPRFLRMIEAVLERNTDLFQVNAVITREVIDRYSVQTLSGILRILKKCGPFFVTSAFLDMADQPPSVNSGWTCAVFSTLPQELFCEKIEGAIDFYLQKSSRETRALWGLWIKWRPLFDLEHPVCVARSGDGVLPRVHLMTLISRFQESKLWPWICSSHEIANAVIQNVSRSMSWNVIRPALHYCFESLLVLFWQGFLECGKRESHNESVSEWMRVLVIFAHRFPGNKSLQSMIIWCLELLVVEPRGRRKFLIVDCYNYLITKLYKNPSYEKDLVSERIGELIKMLEPVVRQALVTGRIENEGLIGPPLFVSEVTVLRGAGGETRQGRWDAEAHDNDDGIGRLFDELSPNWFR